MAFIASNGLTEVGTSKTIQAGGMTIHYHDIGTGEPVVFLHSYGPGTTAWITFYKTVGVLAQDGTDRVPRRRACCPSPNGRCPYGRTGHSASALCR